MARSPHRRSPCSQCPRIRRIATSTRSTSTRSTSARSPGSGGTLARNTTCRSTTPTIIAGANRMRIRISCQSRSRTLTPRSLRSGRIDRRRSRSRGRDRCRFIGINRICSGRNIFVDRCRRQRLCHAKSWRAARPFRTLFDQIIRYTHQDKQGRCIVERETTDMPQGIRIQPTRTIVQANLQPFPGLRTQHLARLVFLGRLLGETVQFLIG